MTFCLVVQSIIKVWCWSLQLFLLICIFLFCQFLHHVFWNPLVRCTLACNCYIFFINWSFYHYEMSFFVSCNGFGLKVCFVLYYCSYSSLPLVTVCMLYLFLYFYISPSSDLESKVYLFLSSCSWIIFYIHSVNLCPFFGVFSPFRFNVITDTVGNLSPSFFLVFYMSYISFFVHLLMPCCLLWVK